MWAERNGEREEGGKCMTLQIHEKEAQSKTNQPETPGTAAYACSSNTQRPGQPDCPELKFNL